MNQGTRQRSSSCTAVCRRVVLGAGHRGSPGSQCARAGAAEPAPGSGPRRGVHRELRQPDRRARAAGRRLLRWRARSPSRAPARRTPSDSSSSPVRARRGRVVRRDLRPVRRDAAGGRGRPTKYPLDNGETVVELTIAPELYREAFADDVQWLSRCSRSATGRSPRSSRTAPTRRPGRRCPRGRWWRPPTTRSPGGRASPGSACGRADDRGRRVALDRALAAAAVAELIRTAVDATSDVPSAV